MKEVAENLGIDTKYIPNQIPIDRTEEIEELVRKNTEGD